MYKSLLSRNIVLLSLTAAGLLPFYNIYVAYSSLAGQMTEQVGNELMYSAILQSGINACLLLIILFMFLKVRSAAVTGGEAEKEILHENLALIKLNKQFDTTVKEIKSLMESIMINNSFSERFDNVSLVNCWEHNSCIHTNCPSYQRDDNMRCWEVAATLCDGEVQHSLESKMKNCPKCSVYRKARGNIASDLGETFNEMITFLEDNRKRLNNSEERLRNVIESSHNAIVSVNIDGEIAAWNPAAGKLFGYKEDEIIGASVQRLIPERFRNAHIEGVKRMKETGSSSLIGRNVEMTGLNNDGREFPIEFSQSAWNVNDEIYFTCTISDITARKEMEDSLINATKIAQTVSQYKSEFLANMSHEIRTPMHGIIGMTDLALQTDLSEKQNMFLTSIKESAGFLLTVLNDILDFSKIEAGKLEMDEINFDLRKSIMSITDLFEKQAADKGIKLTYYIEPDVPAMIKGDPSRIRQIVLNLLGNAFKFTEKGEISVTVKSEPPPTPDNDIFLHFSVSDTGIGIPADKLNDIFESFTQVESTRNRKFGGTGLGLAISTKLVNMMNGDIQVESEEGKGSVFHFTAGFSKYDGSDEQGLFQGHSHSELETGSDCQEFEIRKDKRILLAEDNPMNQQLAKMILEERYTMDIVNNGREALQALESSQYDIVLMDVQMPVMDGYETTIKIRSSESETIREIPIIALTAEAIKGDREKCLEAGMNDYITKPFTMQQLLEIVSRYLFMDSGPVGQTHYNVVEAKALVHDSSVGSVNSSVVDLDSALETLGGKRKLLEKMVNVFYDDMPHQIEKLKQAIADDDINIVRRQAHTIKGSAANIKADLLSEAALQVEIAAREGRGAEAVELSKSLETELNKAFKALSASGLLDEQTSMT